MMATFNYLKNSKKKGGGGEKERKIKAESC